MANTYTQLYIQIVFAVKGRRNLISKAYKEEIHKYISGIIKNRHQKPGAPTMMGHTSQPSRRLVVTCPLGCFQGRCLETRSSAGQDLR